MDSQSAQQSSLAVINILPYGPEQRRRTLNIVLATIMVATFLFGVLNLIFYESRQPAIVFFATSALCLPGFWLNWRGYYLRAGTLAVGLTLAAAHYNLIDGAGLHDPGTVVYPIIVIVGGLLFGKRSVPFFSAACIASLIIVLYAETSFTEDADRLAIISVLILAAGATTWAIMENMDRYIAQIKKSEVELRQAYEQTQDQARQVHRIIETVPEGVLLLNEEKQIILSNQTGQDFLNILAPGHDKAASLNELGGASLEVLLDPKGKDGWQEVKVDEAFFEVAARPVQRESDFARDWVIVLRDVTFQRRQQKAMQEQERLVTVGQLASGIAHDFRNILTVISTYSQILRVKPDSPKRLSHLAVIQEQVQDAAYLIEQILDFGRRSVMERKVTDMVELVEDLIALLQRMIPSNISIHFEHSPGKFTLSADKARLQQAFMNLAVNARDAMPDGGQLEFALSLKRPSAELVSDLKTKPDTWLCLQVRDSGHGIRAADLPHIFEPFYTNKDAGKGTGLGLAQVYGIVKQHEGAITVESTEGQGTMFDLFFPAVFEDPKQTIIRDKEKVRFEDEMTILLVEDNPLSGQVTKEMLQMLGCRVLTADNGREGLAVFEAEQGKIDLVISDIVMPEMGGIELYQALQEKAPDIKMLLITGFPLDDEAQALLDDEVVQWLNKPYGSEEISLKIREVMAH